MFFLPASQKRLLNSLNPLIIVAFVCFLILVRTTMDPLFPNVVHYTDILLPVAVYLGQRRNLIEGLILTVFTSHLYSLCSAAPIGVFVTHYVVIFAAARLLSYAIYANRFSSVLLVMLGLSFFAQVSLAIIASSFGSGWSVFRSFGGFFGWPLLNAAVGSLLYWAVGVLDQMTYKAPRMNIELSEGEI